MSQALVPLWGSKNEVVAPIFRFRTDFLKSVLAKCHFGADFRKNSTQMAFSQNTFYHFLIFVIFGCQNGSRPNLIGSYERAFHKDSKSGLNSKMVIGTQIGNSQNTAEASSVFYFEFSVLSYSLAIGHGSTAISIRL